MWLTVEYLNIVVTMLYLTTIVVMVVAEWSAR